MTNILCLLAHPDDAEIWAGGTLAMHAERKDSVRVITCFDNRPERLEEAACSSVLLGYQHLTQDTPSYQRPDFKALKALVGEGIPDIVITHWVEDCHLEHRKMFEVSVQLVHHWKRFNKKTPILLMVSSYFMMGQNSAFEPDFIVDTSRYSELKTRAIRCHESQHPEHLLADTHSQDRLFGLRIKTDCGEGFKESPLFGCRLMQKRQSLTD